MTSTDPDSFTALADPTRRRILEHLAQTAHMPASDIAAQFTLSKPAISQHLKILKAAQLVSVEVKGQQRIYRLNQAGFDDMSEWITRTRRHWAQALDNLETLLTETPDDDR